MRGKTHRYYTINLSLFIQQKCVEKDLQASTYVSAAQKKISCTFDFKLIYLLELCAKFKLTVVSLPAFFSYFIYYENLVLCHE